MSGDSEKDYFADGMVGTSSGGCLRFKALFVIAAIEFHIQGDAPNVKQVGRELGVPLRLGGSRRKAGKIE